MIPFCCWLIRLSSFWIVSLKKKKKKFKKINYCQYISNFSNLPIHNITSTFQTSHCPFINMTQRFIFTTSIFTVHNQSKIVLINRIIQQPTIKLYLLMTMSLLYVVVSIYHQQQRFYRVSTQFQCQTTVEYPPPQLYTGQPSYNEIYMWNRVVCARVPPMTQHDRPFDGSVPIWTLRTWWCCCRLTTNGMRWSRIIPSTPQM